MRRRARACLPRQACTHGGGDLNNIGPLEHHMCKRTPRIWHAQQQLEVILAVSGILPGARGVLYTGEGAQAAGQRCCRAHECYRCHLRARRNHLVLRLYGLAYVLRGEHRLSCGATRAAPRCCARSARLGAPRSSYVCARVREPRLHTLTHEG
eukprot:180343-Prymnesium_polylepis.1